MRAAVGLLSRSIKIVSDGDKPGSSFDVAPGNPDNYFGGHTIARQGFLIDQMQGVELYELGQGGSIMHYPVHFHMVRQTPVGAGGSEPITFVKDCSIWDSMTRWIVLHGTQGVRLARNVGYESIGHGFYLEDGTETGNQLYANLGVFARAAVANGLTPDQANPQNPRMVPGILTATDPSLTAPPPPPPPPPPTVCKDDVTKCPLGYSTLPYYSDSSNPSVFWIMNGMNDFQYNMAAGAATCGACYWFVPGAISGPSQSEKWYGYAGEQQMSAGMAGTSPLETFIGNSCSTAMEGFVEVGALNACNGVNEVDPTRYKSKKSTLVMLPSPEAPATSDTNYWPNVTGLRLPTRCKDADYGSTTADCSHVAKCASSNEANCDVVVLDKFTTAFNSAETNFAAIWMRSLWSLAVDSVVADPQNAGLNFVTSGGYDAASVFPGYWGLVRQTAFIGSSQWQNSQYKDGLAANPYTSNAGPFNPFKATIGSGADSTINGLVCAPDPFTGNANNAYCMSQNDGVSFQVTNFGGFQRLFSVYDGPIFQDSNAYLDIHPTFLTSDGTITGAVLDTKGGKCAPSSEAGNPCQFAGFISGGVSGLRAYRGTTASANRCFEPNAGIGWKQPNGFFYAPAFHSINLFFNAVDIRHFVTEPSFIPGLFSFNTDVNATKEAYCTWNPATFQGFTDIDRETVLNDDDGTLTGLSSPIGLPTPTPVPTPNPPQSPKFDTFSVNKEDFFDAPTEAWECASDYPANKLNNARCLPATAKTSPYEYVSAVVYPECARSAPLPPPSGAPSFCTDGNWGSVCTTSPPNFGCLGVPLYRQLLKANETENSNTQQHRMMGQNNFQRSALTANHGVYYIKTTVSIDSQKAHNFASFNTFAGGNLYDLFFLYTKADTQQTYQMFVGTGLSDTFGSTNVTFGYEGLTLPFKFTSASSADAATGAWDSKYDPGKGILTLNTNMAKIARIYDLNAKMTNRQPVITLGQQYCQPPLCAPLTALTSAVSATRAALTHLSAHKKIPQVRRFATGQ